MWDEWEPEPTCTAASVFTLTSSSTLTGIHPSIQPPPKVHFYFPGGIRTPLPIQHPTNTNTNSDTDAPHPSRFRFHHRPHVFPATPGLRAVQQGGGGSTVPYIPVAKSTTWRNSGYYVPIWILCMVQGSSLWVWRRGIRQYMVLGSESEGIPQGNRNRGKNAIFSCTSFRCPGLGGWLSCANTRYVSTCLLDLYPDPQAGSTYYCTPKYRHRPRRRCRLTSYRIPPIDLIDGTQDIHHQYR